MSQNNDLDLRAAARSVAVPPGDVDAVVRRGATLAGRRHRLVAGGMAVVLAATAVSYLALTRDGGRPTRVTLGGDANQTLTRGDAGIKWEKTPVRSGLGFLPHGVSGDQLFAISTAPGTAANPDNPDMHPVIWHSDDGVDWSQVDALGDLYLSSIADRGARLYGVGTGPATASVAGKPKISDLVVGSSDNGGHTWDRHALPIDMHAMASKTTRVGVGQVEVAATDHSVVAVTWLIAQLDVPAVLPPGQSAPNGWVTTADGVDVLGDGPECPPGTSTTPPGAERGKPVPNDNGERYPGQCFSPDGTYRSVPPQESRGVKASYTWAQLGVNDDLRKAVRGEPFVFVADAGSTDFGRVEVPELRNKTGNALLNTDNGALLMVVTDRKDDYGASTPTSTLLRSTDGRTWSSGGEPAGFYYAMGVGKLGGRTAIAGGGTQGATLWLSNPDGSWTSSPLAGALDPATVKDAHVEVVAADIGPLGVVTVLNVAPDEVARHGGYDVKSNGYTLHVLNDRWKATVTDAAGKEVGSSESLQQESATAPLRMVGDGSVVLDGADGKTLAKFEAKAMRGVFDNGRNSTAQIDFRLVASRDGATWSDDDVRALAGADVMYVTSVIMKGERAVVTATLRQAPNTKGPAKQVALVGVPK
jgi:hypothetical protein